MEPYFKSKITLTIQVFLGLSLSPKLNQWSLYMKAVKLSALLHLWILEAMIMTT